MATEKPTSEFDAIVDRIMAALLKVAANRLLNPLKAIINLMVPIYVTGVATDAQQRQIAGNMLRIVTFDVEQTANAILSTVDGSQVGREISPNFIDLLLDRLNAALPLLRALRDARVPQTEDNSKLLQCVWASVLDALPTFKDIQSAIDEEEITVQDGIKQMVCILDQTNQPTVQEPPVLPWGN